MEINYIREFLTLVSIGNYLDAAEELYTSSASLARHIKKLEDELGFKLLVPQGRNVVPSALAEEFRPFAEALVRTQEKCFHAIEAAGTRDSRLRIGLLGLENTAYGLSDLLSTFSQAHPEVELEVYEGETWELNGMMQNRLLDMVFSFLPPDIAEREEHVLVVPDEMALYVPVSHPLSARKEISIDDLEGATLIPRPRHSWLDEFSRELLEQRHVTFDTTSFPTNTSMLLSMLAGSSFVSLTPKRSGEYLVALHHKQKQVKVICLSPRVDTSVHLVFPREQHRTPLENRFINFIRKKVSG